MRDRLYDLFDHILIKLEPADVYEQAKLPNSARTLRMRVSDAFYSIFMKRL